MRFFYDTQSNTQIQNFILYSCQITNIKIFILFIFDCRNINRCRIIFSLKKSMFNNYD